MSTKTRSIPGRSTRHVSRLLQHRIRRSTEQFERCVPHHSRPYLTIYVARSVFRPAVLRSPSPRRTAYASYPTPLALSPRVSGFPEGGSGARPAGPDDRWDPEGAWTVDDGGGVTFSASELACITGGCLSGPSSPARGSLCTDSRKLVPGQWMLALEGESFDGHSFLPAALEAGCAGAVGRHPAPPAWPVPYVQVPDTLAALQALAASVRTRFCSGPVVGITGSCGKTTARAMAALVLAKLPVRSDGFARGFRPPDAVQRTEPPPAGRRWVSGAVHCTSGNENNHIGVPQTLLRLPPGASACVLELGMSALGEIAELAEICRPHVRVVLNVAGVHTAGVPGGLDGIAKAKGELLDTAAPTDICVINNDDPRVSGLAVPPGARVVRFGTTEECDVWVDEVGAAGPEGLHTRFRLRHTTPDGTHYCIPVTIGHPGAHLAVSAAAAAAVGVALGLHVAVAARAVEEFRPVGRRMAVRAATGGATVLDDSYNSNPLSALQALRLLASLPTAPQGRRVALLGDMLELGDEAASAHLEVLEAVRGSSGGSPEAAIEVLGTVGPAFSEALERWSLPPGCHVISAADSHELAARVAPLLGSDDVVLVKGSRGMRMEHVVNKLIAESCDV